jgi:hypothetical protein
MPSAAVIAEAFRASAARLNAEAAERMADEDQPVALLLWEAGRAQVAADLAEELVGA